ANGVLKYGFEILVIAIIISLGTWMKKKNDQKAKSNPVQVKMVD
ncbi:TerC family protein, partial [Clostridium perfringens]